MIINAMQALLDIKEAAGFLRVSEASLRRWTNTGRLRCLRIGGRRERRFRREDLEAFLAGSEVGPRPPGGHWCGFYTSDLSRVREAAGFLAAPLGPETRCLVVATQPVQHAVVAALEERRPETRRDLDSGRLALAEYHVSPAAQLAYWRMCVQEALAAGVSHLMVVGDVSGGALGRLPIPEVLEYEVEFGRSIAARFPVTVLCQYDARTLSGVDAAGLLHSHHGVAPAYRSQR